MAHTLRASGNGVQLADRIRSVVADLDGALARRALYRRTVSELQSLSDRELADFGIARSGIRGLARESVYGA